MGKGGQVASSLLTGCGTAIELFFYMSQSGARHFSLNDLTALSLCTIVLHPQTLRMEPKRNASA